MKSLIVLSYETEIHSVQRLKIEAKIAGLHFAVFSPIDLPPTSLDFAVATCGLIPRLGTLKFQQSLEGLQLWETQGFRPVNGSSSYSLARNKLETHDCLRKNLIPVIPTIPWNESFQSPWIYPLVVKPNASSQGRGVQLAQDLDDLNQKARELIQAGHQVIVQPFIAKSKGHDIRIFRSHNDIAVYSRINPDDFRSNIHLGAKAVNFTLTDELKELSRQVLTLLQLDFAGIDLLQTDQGPAVLEVNPSPGFEGLESLGHINAAKMLLQTAEYICNKDQL